MDKSEQSNAIKKNPNNLVKNRNIEIKDSIINTVTIILRRNM